MNNVFVYTFIHFLFQNIYIFYCIKPADYVILLLLNKIIGMTMVLNLNHGTPHATL